MNKRGYLIKARVSLYVEIEFPMVGDSTLSEVATQCETYAASEVRNSLREAVKAQDALLLSGTVSVDGAVIIRNIEIVWSEREVKDG